MNDVSLTNSSLSFFGVFWRLFATLFFVAFNGFFVAAEFALVKARKIKIAALANQGNITAKQLNRILKRLDWYLAACQLGITLASLILGWLAEPAVAQILIAILKAFGIDVGTSQWIHATALVIAIFIITILHMTVGEQAPKMLAIKKAETLALKISLPLYTFTLIFSPFIWLINTISNGILKMTGLSKETDEDTYQSVDELIVILQSYVKKGVITWKQREYSENVLKLMNLNVCHILVPLTDVVYLSLKDSFENNINKMQQSAHSRFPLCEEGLDSIIGIIHTKDVFVKLAEGDSFDLQEIMHKPLFVPETLSLSRFIVEARQKYSHIAFVRNKDKEIVGVVFLEDALEEIVGPIKDEFDRDDDV